ncbi:hypothetical protein HYE67_007913 [Fusarium culmorum]|uniref:Protein RTM1 n=1 Tax=Fusarium culmorum TaxID=5516 RepID=A0A7S8HY48_FUSCU|nr:hypothetical protein HYE67_007913 [Fusarium culmorum]
MVDYYRYEPSLPANVIFSIIFALSSGTEVETIGFIGRAIGADQAPDYTFGPYIMQSLLLLLGPTCYAASIYMILGRLIRLLKAEKYSLIRISWLTKIFLLGDIISIALQGIGGGKLANANSLDDRATGENIIIAGLTVQILFFCLFIIVTGLFHFRFLKDSTGRTSIYGTKWERSLVLIYLASVLILIRSLFRMIEYIEGHDGELQSKEIYILVLDAVPMAIASTMLFNVFHPSKFLNGTSENLADSETEDALGYWQGHSLGTVVCREPRATSNC